MLLNGSLVLVARNFQKPEEMSEKELDFSLKIFTRLQGGKTADFRLQTFIDKIHLRATSDLILRWTPAQQTVFHYLRPRCY